VSPEIQALLTPLTRERFRCWTRGLPMPDALPEDSAPPPLHRAATHRPAPVKIVVQPRKRGPAPTQDWDALIVRVVRLKATKNVSLRQALEAVAFSAGTSWHRLEGHYYQAKKTRPDLFT